MPINEEGFVGIASEERRAIYEAERAAAAIGVLPDEKDKRQAIIDRMKQRLAENGWGFNLEETVVRTDRYGRAHVIPKSQAVGWIRGLPASTARDRTSRQAIRGRSRPYSKRIGIPVPADPPKIDAREAAARFHSRIRGAIEKTGTIPTALVKELWAEGWRLGQPIPLAKVEDWCYRFVNESNRRVDAKR